MCSTRLFGVAFVGNALLGNVRVRMACFRWTWILPSHSCEWGAVAQLCFVWSSFVRHRLGSHGIDSLDFIWPSCVWYSIVSQALRRLSSVWQCFFGRFWLRMVLCHGGAPGLAAFSRAWFDTPFFDAALFGSHFSDGRSGAV